MKPDGGVGLGDERPPLAGDDVVVTGMKAGAPHVGNYFGMIRPLVDLAETTTSYVFIADAHPATIRAAKAEREADTYRAAASLIALGLDPLRTPLYRRSDVSDVFSLAWMIACTTAVNRLVPGHKEGASPSAAGGSPTIGMISYPILMAADILSVQGTLVPIGPDHARDLEIVASLLGEFDEHYGLGLALPRAAIVTDTVLLGTDGRKMSKSLGNTVPIFGSQADVVAQIQALAGRATRARPHDPDRCPLFQLYKNLSSDEDAGEMAARYRASGITWQEVVRLTTIAFDTVFYDARARYLALLEEPTDVEEALRYGASVARRAAEDSLSGLRATVGR